METYGLNPKQIAFADEYIISGNATQSMIKAGYSEKYAGTNSQKLLNNTNIQKYIADRMEEIKSSKIMDQTEVMERLTAIARREVKKGIYNYTEKANGQKVTYEKEYELMPNTEEETKALELIGKRYAMWTDKQEIEQTTVTFVDDVPLDDDD